MTQMIHKNIDQRKHRRTRMKRALKPILELFGCTQMEAAGYIERELRRNNELAGKLADEMEKVNDLKVEVASLKAQLVVLKKA